MKFNFRNQVHIEGFTYASIDSHNEISNIRLSKFLYMNMIHSFKSQQEDQSFKSQLGT